MSSYLKDHYTQINSYIHSFTDQIGLFIIGAVNTLCVVLIGSSIAYIFASYSNPKLSVISSGWIWITAVTYYYGINRRYGPSSIIKTQKSFLTVGFGSLLMTILPIVLDEIAMIYSKSFTLVVAFILTVGIIGLVSGLLIQIHNNTI